MTRKTTYSIALWTLIASSWIITGCMSKHTEATPVMAALRGDWRLSSDTTGRTTLTLQPDTDNPPNDVTPFIATGQAPVNSYEARVFVTLDGVLLVDQLKHTETVGSSAARMAESDYFSKLSSIVRYKVEDGQKLWLYYAKPTPGELLFVR